MIISLCILLYLFVGIIFTYAVGRFATDDGYLHIDEVMMCIFLFWFLILWDIWERIKEQFE